MLRQGQLSTLADTGPFQYLSSYPPALTQVEKTGIPVLDRPTISTSGYPNFNHLAYIRVSDGLKDDLSIIRHRPAVYLKGVAWAFANYFRPAEEYLILQDRLARLEPWTTFYDRAVYLRLVTVETMKPWWPAGTPPKLRTYLEENVSRLSLSLLVGLPMLVAFGLWPLIGRSSALREASPVTRGTL